MIDNFEEYTHELTNKELKLIPMIVKGLVTKVGKEMAITNKEMVTKLKVIGVKVTGPRLRKIIHHIRITGQVERLIATSKGYHVSNEPEEIKEYIESLEQRLSSIEFMKYALEGHLNRLVKLGGRPQ